MAVRRSSIRGGERLKGAEPPEAAAEALARGVSRGWRDKKRRAPEGRKKVGPESRVASSLFRPSGARLFFRGRPHGSRRGLMLCRPLRGLLSNASAHGL